MMTATEKSKYAECRKLIKDGLQTCFEVGAALRQIRDEKLYREDFDTFEDFCGQLYQIGKAHAYRMIEAYDVKDSLPAKLEKHITNESQARALAKADEEDRPEIVQHLVATKTRVTAAAIAETIEKTNETSHSLSPIGDKSELSDAVELDGEGHEIPPDLIQFWRRRDQIQELLTACSKIRSAVRQAQIESDVLWVELTDIQVTQRNLNDVWTQLNLALPYAVCPTCKGKESKCDGCKNCSGRGMVSKFRWKQTSK